MRILIIGAGGVGGYFGACLARAGRDVTFVARGAHGEAMRRHGLRVEGKLGDFLVSPVNCVATVAEAGPADLVILATKLVDLEEVARDVADHISEQALVLTTQNGVEAADMAGAILGMERVIPCVVQIAAQIETSGVISTSDGFARLIFGEQRGGTSSRVQNLHLALNVPGIEAILHDNMPKALWTKLSMLAPLASTTALMRCGIGPIRSHPRSRALLQAAIEEVVAVAEAVGVTFDEGHVAQTMAMFDSRPAGIRASMAQDLDAGKRIELPWLSGAVVRIGEAHGVLTPTHRFFWQALAVNEQGRPA